MTDVPPPDKRQIDIPIAGRTLPSRTVETRRQVAAELADYIGGTHPEQVQSRWGGDALMQETPSHQVAYKTQPLLGPSGEYVNLCVDASGIETAKTNLL